MEKLKVVVYAICKNEEKFVDRWFESMKEADEIYVLDTGSEDDTIEKLKSHNINVKQQIVKPWRFDVARNLSLDMVPDDTDICVCTDLDEVFNLGWREKLENVWKEGTNRCKYIYNWSLDEQNKPLVSFYYEKIHSRNNFKWVNPVHEILKYSGGEEKSVITDEIILNHYPDPNKSRSSYLSLLELSFKEDPNNDRNVHYLGREYMYYEKYNECIDTLIIHLNMENATWKDERCASMRFIARSYKCLKRYDEARMWLDKAMKEAPHLRDPFIERALLEYDLNNWKDVINYCNFALQIKNHTKSYINEVFSFDETPYDLLSIAYYYESNFEKALESIDEAIKINPDSKRLNENRELILKALK